MVDYQPIVGIVLRDLRLRAGSETQKKAKRKESIPKIQVRGHTHQHVKRYHNKETCPIPPSSQG